MSILCNLQNMSLSFGQKAIFQNAKFSIQNQDRIGLIGLNGHGKSTLFNILSGAITPDISTPPFIFDKNNENFSLFLIPQEVNFWDYPDLDIENFWLSYYPEIYELNKKLKIIENQLMENYEDESLINKQQILLEQYEALGAWTIESSYLSYLGLFDFEITNTPVAKLSGGEQKKLALSVGLSAQANLVLWDEPTNHLDVETIEKFEDELSNSQKTFMIISHDRYLLNNVCNRIVHIERGEINSHQGNYLEYLEYLEERDKELAKNLDKLQNKHRRELAWMRQGIKARGTRSKKRVEGYHNIKDDIKDLKARAKKVVDLSLQHSGRKSKQLIEITDGNFGYNDDNILRDLNLLIAKKDKIALIGPNGAGKSTLLKILTGELELKSGNYKALDGLKAISFDQKREQLDDNKSLFELIGDGQDFVHLGDGTTKHVVSYLESFLFDNSQIHRPISTLSGGEKNRLQLALFMKNSADLWIFDEPTNDLDIETIELLESELASYEAAIIIVGHDRAFLDNTCKVTWLLNDKQIEVFEGGYSQVAPYLQALELEKKQNSKKTSKKEKMKSEKKPGLSNKEMIRFEKSEISEFEDKLEKVQTQITKIDFSENNPSEMAKFESLDKEQKELQKKLDSLMLEWEDLESRKD